MDNVTYIYFSNGDYFGFIKNDALFSRDGDYIGWIEQGKYVWDSQGRFRGLIAKLGEYNYILNDRFSMPPLPRSPRVETEKIAPPPPKSNIPAIALPPSMVDAFNSRTTTK